jgi:hypothetical protein
MLVPMSWEEIFQPGLRHWREQQESDRQKTIVVPAPGPGPIHVDLDAGVIELRDPDALSDRLGHSAAVSAEGEIGRDQPGHDADQADQEEGSGRSVPSLLIGGGSNQEGHLGQRQAGDPDSDKH